jgi:thiol:disulfide interchange protein
MIGLAIGAGFATLLTPCILAMLPVMVAYFGRESSGVRAAVVHAACFGAGITMTFGLGGALASAFVGAMAVQRAGANPWLNLTMGVAFLLLGLNLLGVFQVRLPGRVLGALQVAVSRQRAFPVMHFLAGVVFAIASLTCATPLVGSLLVLSAREHWGVPAVALTFYGLAVSAPFLLLACVPRLARALAASGMAFKHALAVFGIVELCIAIKYFANADAVWRIGLLDRTATIIAWSVVVLGAAALINRSWWMTPKGRWSWGLTATAVLITLGGALRGGSLGPLEVLFPPSAKSPDVGDLVWYENTFALALEEARVSGKPIFVDFTGYTCTNCRWMERNVFTHASVKAELRQFVRVRLFTDGEGLEYEAQQAMQERLFGTVALPLYAVFDPSGIPLRSHVGMTRDTVVFLRFLRGRKT